MSRLHTGGEIVYTWGEVTSLNGAQHQVAMLYGDCQCRQRWGFSCGNLRKKYDAKKLIRSRMRYISSGKISTAGRQFRFRLYTAEARERNGHLPYQLWDWWGKLYILPYLYLNCIIVSRQRIA